MKTDANGRTPKLKRMQTDARIQETHVIPHNTPRALTTSAICREALASNGEVVALRAHLERTACILRTQMPEYSPKITYHLSDSTAKQQSPQYGYITPAFWGSPWCREFNMEDGKWVKMGDNSRPHKLWSRPHKLWSDRMYGPQYTWHLLHKLWGNPCTARYF